MCAFVCVRVLVCMCACVCTRCIFRAACVRVWVYVCERYVQSCMRVRAQTISDKTQSYSIGSNVKWQPYTNASHKQKKKLRTAVMSNGSCHSKQPPFLLFIFLYYDLNRIQITLSLHISRKLANSRSVHTHLLTHAHIRAHAHMYTQVNRPSRQHTHTPDRKSTFFPKEVTVAVVGCCHGLACTVVICERTFL